MSISRRSFLVGGAMAAGLATMGLAGCSPAENGSKKTTGEGEASPDSQNAGYRTSGDWLGQAPSVGDDEITDTVSVDVVVIGGGHSGTQCALAATQGGATVAVIEQHNDGEIIYRGAELAVFNAKWMIDQGFGPYNLQEVVNEFVRRGAGRMQTGLVRNYVYNSGEMLDNLLSIIPDNCSAFDIDNGKCVIQSALDKNDGSYYPIEVEGYKCWATSWASSYTTDDYTFGKAGYTFDDYSRMGELETYCRDAAEDSGATWYCGYVPCVLSQDENGDVTGVVAQNSDGAYVEFKAAKGVVIATGDFGGNPDMIWELCTEFSEIAERCGLTRNQVTGRSDCDGGGLKLGCWAGGMLEPSPRIVAGEHPNLGFGPFGSAPFLWLNPLGKRFMNEGMSTQLYTQSMRQPVANVETDCNFAIVDSKYMQYIENCALDHGTPVGSSLLFDSFVEDMQALDPSVSSGEVTNCATTNTSNISKGVVYVGNTAEEALKNAGFSGEVLENALASLQRYNELCASGIDEDYCKDPARMIAIDSAPFYVALQGTPAMHTSCFNTHVGLIVSDDYEVLRNNGTEPIKGLYATGNCIGQRFGVTYTTPASGNAMANAWTSGRLVGKLLARA